MPRIIFHHNDADGRCAAAIMQNYMGKPCRTVEVDYKDPIDLSVITKGDIVAIVDFSFKPNIMAKVRGIADRVIWCDHHITAKEYGYNDLEGVRDFDNKGKSGCECTWEFCYPNRPKPEALQLLGDYDAWRLELAPRSFQFFEGLKLEDTAPDSKLWADLLFNKGQDKLIKKIVDNGALALLYRDNYCKSMAENYGYETSLCGHKIFALNVYAMGNRGLPEEIRNRYQVRAAYIHDGHKFTVSLYSDNVDVSEIAKRFGGGGHKEAAGFTCAKLPWDNYEFCEV